MNTIAFMHTYLSACGTVMSHINRMEYIKDVGILLLQVIRVLV